MILRPRTDDFLVIGRHTGRIVAGVGFLMLLPLLVALLSGEGNPAVDFLVGFGACLAVGVALERACRAAGALSWTHGMVIAGVSWLAAMALGAVPSWLSGHYGSYLDACFDAMSGMTTTGLFLLQDLDHASAALNTWRHLLSWAGGQGIIVVALAFLASGSGAGAYTLYVGEAKEERLLPSVVATARAIWFISFTWMTVGTLALLHGLRVFMGGWSTGGFAPMAANMLYYHSALYEMIAIGICIVGSFNFALHWAVWTGNRAELRRNVELVSFAATMTIALRRHRALCGAGRAVVPGDVCFWDNGGGLVRRGRRFRSFRSGLGRVEHRTFLRVDYARDAGRPEDRLHLRNVGRPPRIHGCHRAPGLCCSNGAREIAA